MRKHRECAAVAQPCLLILGAVLSLLAGSVAALKPNICTGHPVGTAIRNTQNCGTFYACVNGQPILTPCPSGQLFNHVERRCDSNREAVECFQCPEAIGFLDVPVVNECAQFVRCFNNRSQQLTCAEGLAFDRSVRMCNLAERVVCPFEVECPRRTPRPIFTRHPDDCAIFTVCANGNLQEYHCPDTLYLNEATKQCDHPANSKCSNAPTQPPPTQPPPTQPTPTPTTAPTDPPPPKLVCPRNGGPLFPHPTDCSLTYSCSPTNEALVYPCREGLYFDYEQQYCAPPGVVKCFDSSANV